MNAETKWTPGPWVMETVRTSCGLCHKVGPFPSPKSRQQDKPAHACIYDDYPPDGGSPELVANARLIAAAPDLFEALERISGLVSASKSSSDNDRLYAALGTLDKAREIARAALSKAGG